MKNKIFAVLLSLLLCFTLSFSLVGCSKNSKEDIAYKMICYVADAENGGNVSNITLESGKLELEEDGTYFANFKVKVDSTTKYFTGTYDPQTKEITYKDMTNMFGLVPPGPAYSETDSFDIEKVNKKLK